MSADENNISWTNPELQKCPFEYYARTRSRCPVYTDPVTGAYILTAYETVRKATMDTANFSNRTGQISVREGSAADEVQRIYREHGWLPVHTLVNNDPPEHTRFRALIDKAFTAKKVRALEPSITNMVDELIDGFVAEERIEFMSRFGSQLPLLVFCQELGVPRQDIAKFRHWSDVLLEQMNPLLTPEREIQLTYEVCELENYLIGIANRFRITAGNCILSDLVHADVDGEHLNDAELVSVIMQLVPAGHETTANAIGTGVLYLARDPELAERLRRQPELMRNFVEEVLRIDAPVQGLWRRAQTDVDIGGTHIPEDSTLVLSWGAANRDPDQFPNPDQIDLDRPNLRGHLSFGFGAHFCVGNALSRAEMRIAFTQLLARLKDIRLPDGEQSVEYRPHFFAHGPARLDIAYSRGA